MWPSFWQRFVHTHYVVIKQCLESLQENNNVFTLGILIDALFEGQWVGKRQTSLILSLEQTYAHTLHFLPLYCHYCAWKALINRVQTQKQYANHRHCHHVHNEHAYGMGETQTDPHTDIINTTNVQILGACTQCTWIDLEQPSYTFPKPLLVIVFIIEQVQPLCKNNLATHKIDSLYLPNINLTTKNFQIIKKYNHSWWCGVTLVI